MVLAFSVVMVDGQRCSKSHTLVARFGAWGGGVCCLGFYAANLKPLFEERGLNTDIRIGKG
jgi:hypothetical protein